LSLLELLLILRPNGIKINNGKKGKLTLIFPMTRDIPEAQLNFEVKVQVER